MKALVCAAALGVAGAAQAELIDPEALRFEGADVVIMGERHDNPVHHVNQAAWIARLQPAAVVFEMLTPDLALTAESNSDPAVLGAVLRWEERGWPDFTMYYPVFRAAREAAIFGGGVPTEEARLAVSDGAASVMGPAAEMFGLDLPLSDEEQATREEDQATAHCDALPDDVLPGMVEAQRLRDAALARAVIAAMAETGGPVAVVTGNGHARRDRGVPAALEAAGQSFEVLSIGQLEAPAEGAVPYDVWTVTDAPERPDPCEAFR
ncbi:ChaN family lipoprotein [Tranquillimonas rosea]|uniref:ChaN family lipoprotein n=1 Tax=Tranquillimonas rosea TaxID=641238 RepID=UPI003BABC5F3